MNMSENCYKLVSLELYNSVYMGVHYNYVNIITHERIITLTDQTGDLDLSGVNGLVINDGWMLNELEM